MAFKGMFLLKNIKIHTLKRHLTNKNVKIAVSPALSTYMEI